MPFPADTESASAFLFPYRIRRVGLSGLTVEERVFERSTIKPLEVQWPPVRARMNVYWRASAFRAGGHLPLRSITIV